MEKYEINKYLATFSEQVDDLYQSLNIEKLNNELPILAKKVEDPNLWNDPQNANKIIANYNSKKENVSIYNEMSSKLSDMKDSLELIDDPEYAKILEDEIIAFEKRMKELEIRITLSGEYDNSGVIMEFHPGAGGTESMDWALMLYRMYQRYCQRQGFKFNTIDYQPGEAGIKSATVEISGPFAYGLLKSERGVHRLVRISPFDANKRRHTSFASIDIAPVIENNNDIVINDEEIRIDTYCSSGAGGQGVNTTYSAVRVTHLPTNTVVTCQNERSQIQNKEQAMKVLKARLYEMEVRRKEEENGAERKSKIGTGDRAEKIRTYNYPQNRVTDHRIGFTIQKLDRVMEGDLDEILDALKEANERDLIIEANKEINLE